MKLHDWETYKEIHNQPAIWRGWADEFADRATELRQWVAALNVDEIWLSGAGTSAYIGDLLAMRKSAMIDQQVVILPDVCHDQGFAMTSSYSTMLLTALLVLDAKTKPQDLHNLADAADALLAPLQKFASANAMPERLVFVGFGRGPKSFINPQTHVFIFQSNNSYTAQYDRDLTAEVREQFGADSVTTLGAKPDHDIKIAPQGNDALDALLYVLFSQILATGWSDEMGLNVDDPFKGRGTLTRVVSGVKLYLPEAD